MIGMGELLVILLLVLFLFGGKRLPELARNLGKGMREFKQALSGIECENCPDKKEEKCKSSCDCTKEKE